MYPPINPHRRIALVGGWVGGKWTPMAGCTGKSGREAVRLYPSGNGLRGVYTLNIYINDLHPLTLTCSPYVYEIPSLPGTPRGTVRYPSPISHAPIHPSTHPREGYDRSTLGLLYLWKVRAFPTLGLVQRMDRT